MKTSLLQTLSTGFLRALHWAVCLAPLLAGAHVAETGQGKVSLVGQQAVVAVAVPMAAFTGCDDNGDGLLDAAEIQAHQAQLLAQVQHGLRLWGDGQRAVWGDMVLTPGVQTPSGAPAQAKQLLVMGSASWNQVPARVTLEFDLWSRTETTTPVALASALAPTSETLKITVTRSQDGHPVAEEVGLLSPQHQRLEFFAPIARHVANFASHGLEHILGGPDHLVFLVALLASAIQVRRWVQLLTAFTLAHGLTFGLASLGWVNVPAGLVEPAIAATIVLVAALDLLKVRLALRWELLLVLGLGLIHGLGFASAMQEGGAGQLIALSPYPVWSIVGFNLGIEAGQCAVAVVLYAVIWVLRRTTGPAHDAVFQRTAALFALLMGAFWLVERLM